MAKWKVVVTDFEYSDLRYEEKVLQHEDIELIKAQCKTEDDIIQLCRDADALITLYAPISRKVIESLEKCKVITRYGVGVNTIDLQAASEKGICVANVPDYCMDEVSDHALALILAMTRKIVAANNDVKKGGWDFKVTQPIHRMRGKVVGLVTFGKIPRTLTPKVQALGFTVITYDPFVSEQVAAEYGVKLVSLDELCQLSDVISVHAPLMAQTQGMISTKQFSQMKKDAILINTSRGPVVDQETLVEALQNGMIQGAALDVVEEEPLPQNSPLRQMDNVILTPHVAWYSEESAVELRTKAALGVLDVLLHGEYPKYLVNQNVKEKLALTENHPGDRYAPDRFTNIS